MEIRGATERDWPHIEPIVRATIEAGDTYTWGPYAADAARDWWLQIGSPGWTFVAVDDDGAVLGTAKCGRNQGGGGDHVGSASFMVSADHAGRGIGRALAEHVIATLRTEGFRSIQFNAVVESNVRAVRLWMSLGFRILTTVPEGFLHPTKGYVGLHVMYLSLLDE